MHPPFKKLTLALPWTLMTLLSAPCVYPWCNTPHPGDKWGRPTVWGQVTVWPHSSGWGFKWEMEVTRTKSLQNRGLALKAHQQRETKSNSWGSLEFSAVTFLRLRIFTAFNWVDVMKNKSCYFICTVIFQPQIFFILIQKENPCPVPMLLNIKPLSAPSSVLSLNCLSMKLGLKWF